MAKLRLSKPSQSSARLEFVQGGSELVTVTGALGANCPTAAAQAKVQIIQRATLHGVPPPVRIAGEVGHNINVDRGPKSAQGYSYRQAATLALAAADNYRQSISVAGRASVRHRQAAASNCELMQSLSQLPRLQTAAQSDYRQAATRAAAVSGAYRQLSQRLSKKTSGYQQALKARATRAEVYTYPARQDHTSASAYRSGAPTPTTTASSIKHGQRLLALLISSYRPATTPTWITRADPPKPPEPPTKSAALNFKVLRLDEALLEFVQLIAADHQIPIRKVYLMQNSATLLDVNGNELPATSINLSLDDEATCWRFSATLASSVDVQALVGQQLQAQINGQHFKLLLDSYSTERSFGNRGMSLQGRGLSALLSATDSRKRSGSNSEIAQVSQLAEAALPAGWTIDWRAVNWLLESGQLSYSNAAALDIIKQLASAAGAFIRPDQNALHLVVLPNYAAAPWELAQAAVSLSIPEAVMLKLSTERKAGINANGVSISGGYQGISASIRRIGTAGDITPTPITDPLITDIAAARALGVKAICDARPQLIDRIELPVGGDIPLVLPGQLISTGDNRAYTTGISLSASRNGNALQVRQQLTTKRVMGS